MASAQAPEDRRHLEKIRDANLPTWAQRKKCTGAWSSRIAAGDTGRRQATKILDPIFSSRTSIRALAVSCSPKIPNAVERKRGRMGLKSDTRLSKT